MIQYWCHGTIWKVIFWKGSWLMILLQTVEFRLYTHEIYIMILNNLTAHCYMYHLLKSYGHQIIWWKQSKKRWSYWLSLVCQSFLHSLTEMRLSTCQLQISAANTIKKKIGNVPRENGKGKWNITKIENAICNLCWTFFSQVFS